MPALAKLPALVLASCLAPVAAFSGRPYNIPPSRYPIGYDPDNRSRPAWHPDAFRHYAAFPAEDILLPRPQYPPLSRPWREKEREPWRRHPRNTSTPSPSPDPDSDTQHAPPRWQPPEGYVPRSRPPTPRPSPRWEPPEGYSPKRRTAPDYPDTHHYNPRRPPTLQRTTNGPDATFPNWNEYVAGGGLRDDTAPPDVTLCPTDEIDPCALAGCTPDDGRIHLCTGIWMGRKILQRRCLRLDP